MTEDPGRARFRVIRSLAIASVLLATCGIVTLAGRASFGFWSWACLAVATGLALAILVVQASRDPLLPRRLAALVVLAPVFGGAYALGRLLLHKPVSWVHVLELTGISFLLFGACALAVLALRKA